MEGVDEEELYEFSRDTSEAATTWYALAKDCTCCGGFIYGCKTDLCQSLGVCSCSYEEDEDAEDEQEIEEAFVLLTKGVVNAKPAMGGAGSSAGAVRGGDTKTSQRRNGGGPTHSYGSNNGGSRGGNNYNNGTGSRHFGQRQPLGYSESPPPPPPMYDYGSNLVAAMAELGFNPAAAGGSGGVSSAAAAALAGMMGSAQGEAIPPFCTALHGFIWLMQRQDW